MGCSGNNLVKTPNMDSMAASGTRFAKAWTTSPICVPARASVATGLFPHQNRYWDNAIAYDGAYKSWGHSLQRNGMRVESMGKLHYRNESDDTGFDKQHSPMHIAGGIGLIWASVRDPLPFYDRRSTIFDELGAGTSSYNRYDHDITRMAVAWLEDIAQTPEDKPWILSLGYVAPHMPFMVPQPYLDMYPLEKINVPDKLIPAKGHSRHPWVEQLARNWDHDAALGTDERRRLAVQCYLGLISYLDDQIGIVMEVLRRTGLLGNTRVIYSTDHGDNLGTRGLWNKSTMYRESTAIPMIAMGEGIPAGKTCMTNVGLADLYPTFLECVGLTPTDEERALPGKSLLTIANEDDDESRVGFSEYHALGSPSAAYMVTKARYKFHYYVGFPAELFDLQSDPEELVNIASEPAMAHVVAELELELRKLLDPEKIDRMAKDDQNTLVNRHGGPEAVRVLGNQGSTATPDKYRMA
ncbi:choline-sulfatase [Polaromonas sp. OV174]|nr:choline-sulfatase [Polaromonas sp. OV174]